MATIDWVVLACYFVLTAFVGVFFSRRAGRNTGEFFVGGRKLAWWIAGLSMVATTFAADTPLAVTELVATRGVAGNWLWWNMVIGGMMTVFFFARLWRRSEALTDLEFIEMRYSGRPAAFLRGFRAVYLGLFLNAIIMGWVNLAMASLLEGFFGIPHEEVFWYLTAALALTAAYSSLSGLWGVAATDAVQFVIAMTGCIVLACIVIQSPPVGGIDGLHHKLPATAFHLFPRLGGTAEQAAGMFSLSAGAFFAYVGVQWWASWYPGSEPGGGGYVAQRMLATKNERESVFSVLLFQIAHYCLRPWPWILVGLASLVLYPSLPAAEKKLGFVFAMRDYLPAGVRGLLIAAFFAAYMSTIATHLNWGTSYLVHDLWRRFIRPGLPESSYIRISRVVTLLLMLASIVAMSLMTSISGAWVFLIECGAGLGLVLIVRWYWWRINAWSEIAATAAPILAVAAITLYNGVAGPQGSILFPYSLFITVGWTTLTWLVVTFLTPPVDRTTLERFFDKIRPGGPFWKPISMRFGRAATEPIGHLFVAWIFGVVFVYSLLFGSGALIFGHTEEIFLWAGVSLASGIIVFFSSHARSGDRISS
ncbi:MAG: Na+:solute symporter [Bacteroidota bacterium]|nr:Na+:solute symporter [Bacteroidota bacterium]